MPPENITSTASCPFCGEHLLSKVKASLGSVVAIDDNYPVTIGHMLIIPRRHTPDYFTMSSDERRDAEALISKLRNEILETDPSVVGFNIGANCGEAAGQTVMHAHIHLIPRRHGDTSTPKGGIRGVIPSRMSY